MIFTIGDLHLGFSVEKPMDIFGDNWKSHDEQIKLNWINSVQPGDTVILPGDFSWGIDLNEAKADFEFLNSLPGTKILSKGNHDYYWTTLKKMNEFLKVNNFENIYFMQNNSYVVENKIIIELKSVSSLISGHRAQLFNYMRLTRKRVGLLINFGEPTVQVERYGLIDSTNECILLDKDMQPVQKRHIPFKNF